MNGKKQATMADIAAYCKVSKATISRAVNTPDKLRPDTRKKIEDAFRQMGYQYNPLAASMTKSSAKLLGVMAGSLRESLYMQSIAAIQNVAATHDFNVMFSISNFDPQREQAILTAFQSYKTAGIIVLGTSLSCAQQIIDLLSDRTPHLILWEDYDLPGINSIGTSSDQMLEKAVSYLVGLGHQRIGLVLTQDLTVHRATKRYAAFAKALSRFNLPFDSKLVHFLRTYQLNPSAMESGRSALSALITLPQPPTAIIFPTGMLALGGIMELKARELSCPKDMSIFCLGDDDAAQNFIPGMDSIASHFPVISNEIDIFVKKLTTPPSEFSPRHYALTSEIVPRGSCASPAYNPL